MALVVVGRAYKRNAVFTVVGQAESESETLQAFWIRLTEHRRISEHTFDACDQSAFGFSGNHIRIDASVRHAMITIHTFDEKPNAIERLTELMGAVPTDTIFDACSCHQIAFV